MSVPNPTAAPAADPKKALRSLAGILLGLLFVALYYPGIFLLSCLVAKAAPGGSAAQILLGLLGVAVLFPFFWLNRWLTKRLACGRNAFPAGAFLAADALLLAIPLADLLNAARLLRLAGGDKALAQQYVKNCAVLIFALVLLVVSWLITVFWRVFKRFRAMSEALERELAAARAVNTGSVSPAAADTPAAPEIPTASGNPEIPARPAPEAPVGFVAVPAEDAPAEQENVPAAPDSADEIVSADTPADTPEKTPADTPAKAPDGVPADIPGSTAAETPESAPEAPLS